MYQVIKEDEIQNKHVRHKCYTYNKYNEKNYKQIYSNSMVV